MSNYYANTQGYIFLKIGPHFFKRISGVGWIAISREDAASVDRWSVLHPLQEEAYYPILREQGLIE